MLKKLKAKFSVSHQVIIDSSGLRWIRPLLIRSVPFWTLKNRYGVAMGVALGLFGVFMPIPFQLIIITCLALLIRANLPIAFAVNWINNPFTMAPIIYINYKIGALLLGSPHTFSTFEPSISWLKSEMSNIWQPFLLGSLVCGLFAGLLGFAVSWVAYHFLNKA